MSQISLVNRRIAKVCGDDVQVEQVIERMVNLSLRGLPKMFRENAHEFGFTMRGPTPLELEGSSLRYGAIVLLGAANLDEQNQREIFGGENAYEFCGRLIGRIKSISNLGDVALVTWAAALLGRMDVDAAIERMWMLWNRRAQPFTVEAAWTLSALAQAHTIINSKAMAQTVRDRLIRSFGQRGNIFPHRIGDTRGVRGHVGCFADQVYSIQALSRFHHVFSDRSALTIAARCAQQICCLQGDGGQWWWHYDSRNGRVIEGYPVYSVHQNSMAPMALLDLHEAGGPDLSKAIRRGLRWMNFAPEIQGSLIDEQSLVIWRKVGRSDPKKFVRGARAVLSKANSHLRMKWMNRLFPARKVDFECRPYHLGWILHTWLGGL
jgi:hypothetical protein